jgi:hypothetical protein
MKQIIVLRNDLRADNDDFFLKCPNGETCRYFRSFSNHSIYFQMKQGNQEKIEKWMQMPHKVCLGVANEEVLKNLIEKACKKNIFVLSKGFYKEQRELNIINVTDPRYPNYIKFENGAMRDRVGKVKNINDLRVWSGQFLDQMKTEF